MIEPRGLGYERLNDTEIYLLDTLCGIGNGEHTPALAKRTGYRRSYVKRLLGDALRKTSTANRIQLCIAWRCPLFQLGLKELGIRR